jgi:hypothetical protein
MILKPSVVLVLALLGTTELANAACSFILLDNRAPVGQSLKHITERLGVSGYSRLPDEDSWSFERSEFQKTGVVAPLADEVSFGTYKNIVFKSNLRYRTKNLKSARADLARNLDACATRVNTECWRDESASFYEIGTDSKDTYLYITSPNYGSPSDPDLPPRLCR